MLISRLIDGLVIRVIDTRASSRCILTLFRTAINILFSALIHNSFKLKCSTAFVFLNEIPDGRLLILDPTYLTADVLRPLLDFSRL